MAAMEANEPGAIHSCDRRYVALEKVQPHIPEKSTSASALTPTSRGLQATQRTGVEEA